MDMNLTLPKEQWCFECVDNIDRINKLPDEILGKILNYLPTKQAVSTSILSKRWEYLWTLTSDFDFSDNWQDYDKDENVYLIKMRSFQKYVDRVIFYHGASNIRKCKMSFHSTYLASSFYTWIFAVITCNVQELSLHHFESEYLTYYYQLPWRFFSCNTLVVLTIIGDFVLDLPTYVCFPCLKLLDIAFVVFVDDASMERFFSSCPVLEELRILRLMDCLEIMNIYVPSLKRLCICNVGPRTIQIKINTPCLEYLQIFHYEKEPCRYFVKFTSSLVRAELKGCDIFLLNAISQVEYLILTAHDRRLQYIIRDSALPVLKNLKTLKLRVGGQSTLNNDHWKVLPNLLDSSPNLQILIFQEGLLPLTINLEDFNHFDWQRPESVPDCLSLHLKTIEIFEFVGCQEELDIVEYLLESAKVLEKMIIHRFDISKHPKMEMKVKGDMVLSELLRSKGSCSTSEVMSFKRSWSTCQVIFTD